MMDDENGQTWLCPRMGNEISPIMLDSLKQTMKLMSADISQAKVETLLDHLGKKLSGGQFMSLAPCEHQVNIFRDFGI